MAKVILDDTTYINKEVQNLREMAAAAAAKIYNEMYAKKVDSQYFFDYFNYKSKSIRNKIAYL